MLNHLDRELLLAINGLFRAYSWLPEVASGLALNPIARGVPVFVPLVILWFLPDHIARRGQMTLGLLGACFATMISVLLQKYLHVNIRPAFDPSLHLYQAVSLDLSVWDRSSSFPSDTATLFFALSMVIFLEWRWAGVLAYAWSFVTAGICRVALGFHYPSDVVVGIILGGGTVYLFTGVPLVTNWVQGHLDRAQTRLPWVHAAFFLLLADAYNLFPGLQGVVRVLTRIGRWG